MSNDIPLKEYLDEKFKDIKEDVKNRFEGVDKRFDSVEDHLKTLNGQTAKNTDFRNRSIGIYLGISGVVGVLFTAAGFIISKI